MLVMIITAEKKPSFTNGALHLEQLVCVVFIRSTVSLREIETTVFDPASVFLSTH